METADPLVLIVGCGRLGSFLATKLHRQGCAVTVVDRDASSFASLPESLAGGCVEGVPLRLEVLRRARIEDAELLIATTGTDDLNLALALLGRRLFRLEHLLARVHDPARAESYGRLGIQAVCPTTLVASAFGRLIAEAAGARGA